MIRAPATSMRPNTWAKSPGTALGSVSANRDNQIRTSATCCWSGSTAARMASSCLIWVSTVERYGSNTVSFWICASRVSSRMASMATSRLSARTVVVSARLRSRPSMSLAPLARVAVAPSSASMIRTSSSVWSASVPDTVERSSTSERSSTPRPPKPTEPVSTSVATSLATTEPRISTARSATNSSSGAWAVAVMWSPSARSVPAMGLSVSSGRSSMNFSPSSDVVRSSARDSLGMKTPSLIDMVTSAL